MTRRQMAKTRFLLPALVCILLHYSVSFSAETAPQVPQELYKPLREVTDILGFFLIFSFWFLLGTGTTASCLLGRAFWVDPSNQADVLTRNVTAGKSFLVGALNFIILFLIALVLLDWGWWVVSVLIFLFLTIMTYVGLLSTATTLGERVLALRAEDSSDFARVLVGNATLFTAALIPIIGWAFFLYIVMKSFGIGLIWLVRRKSLGQEVIKV